MIIMITKDVEAKNIKIIRDIIKSDMKHQGNVTALLDEKSKVKLKSGKELEHKEIYQMGSRGDMCSSILMIVKRCQRYRPSS